MIGNLIISFLAAIGLLSMIIYVMITVFYLLGKEEWISEFIKTFLPKSKVDTKLFVALVRPMFLLFSIIGIVPMAIIGTGALVDLYKLCLWFNIIVSIGYLIKNLKK